MIEVSCWPVKRIFYDETSRYCVWVCKPTEIESDLELTKYKRFTVSGEGIEFFEPGKEIKLKVEKDDNSKYEASYKMCGLGGVSSEGEEYIVNPDQEMPILMNFMSESKAVAINEAYPDFVQKVINGHEDEIDLSLIKGVGDKLFAKYVEKLKTTCTGFAMLGEISKYGMKDMGIAMKATKLYHYPENFSGKIHQEPYETYEELTSWGFNKRDGAVIDFFPDFRVSMKRCLEVCKYFLKENEAQGDTRLQASILAKLVLGYAPELKEYLYKVVTENDELYYDKDTKYVSLRSTYDEERIVARVIMEKLAPVFEYNFHPENFREVDGFKLTDEQYRILEAVQDNGIVILDGPAGCVDADTEFFNGEKWKRIADYEEGEQVLQYNQDGTATLVNPICYIKQPCNYLWHFETKYGVNQTLCDEHRIVYWSKKGFQRECNISDIIKHSPQSDEENPTYFQGRFKTSFKYSGEGIPLTDAEIKVMCAVICDGSFLPSSERTKRCRFHIKKERKKERLREIFAEAGLKWEEHQSAAERYTDFYIYAPLRTKIFDKYWYQCSNEQLQIICDNILFWDGNITVTKKGVERKRFSSNVKENADFVQFAFSSCGYRANILEKDRRGQQYFTCGKWYTRKSKEYDVTITKKIFTGLTFNRRKNHKQTKIERVETTDGYKYCFSVPSSYLVLRRKNCIFVTGNCGKSSTVRALLRMLEHAGKNYTLLAPTGVATKVLKKLTGRDAQTIAMNLVCGERLKDFVIVDEFSLVNIHTVAALFDKIQPTNRIVLVCDSAQLAPIGAGNPLQDMLSSKLVPTVTLTKVFRYGQGGIATYSTDAKDCKDLDIKQVFTDTTVANLTKTDDIFKATIQAYKTALEKGYKRSEILCLCPFNKSKIGTVAINNAIQAEINNKANTKISFTKEGIGVTFKIGDRVINKRNNYHAHAWDNKITAQEIFIANGDIGTIIGEDIVYDDETEAILDYHLIVRFDNGTVALDKKECKNLLLGYCISVHSSQGSQAPCVIFVSSSMHSSMLTSNLVYVALSRAQKELTIIGDCDTINEGIKIKENFLRDTWLKEMLIEGE